MTIGCWMTVAGIAGIAGIAPKQTAGITPKQTQTRTVQHAHSTPTHRDNCNDHRLLVHPDRRTTALLWVALAKAGPRYDNRDPRAWMAKLDNPRKQRAYNAQLNAFEAFAPFAAGVLMAQLAGVDPQRIAWLAIAFVVLRVLHGIFYITNVHAMRSLVWFGGFACVVALMVLAAFKLG